MATAASIYFVFLDKSAHMGLLNSIKHPVFSLIVFVFVALTCWLIAQIFYYFQWRQGIRDGGDGAAAHAAYELASIRSAGTLGTADQIPARQSLQSLRDDIQGRLSQRWAYLQIGCTALLFLWVLLFAARTLDNHQAVLPSDSLSALVLGIGSASVLFFASLILSMLSASDVTNWYEETLFKTGCEIQLQLPLADTDASIENAGTGPESDPFATRDGVIDDPFASSFPSGGFAAASDPFGDSSNKPDDQAASTQSSPFEHAWDESASMAENSEPWHSDEDGHHRDALDPTRQSALRHGSSGDPTDSIF